MASNSGQTLLAILTGAAIGAGIGILYAPDKGSKTRNKISNETAKRQKELTKQLKKTSEALGAKAKDTKLTLEQKLESAISSASYKADDVLSALEGKLETLREKNAKLQRDNTVEKVKTSVKKATS
ncbi:MAG: YtxH domain-containing protein [Patiriisocius sp.]|uniref:YtxH domain-containing protein n=1 Tax=Patiriisocius sp. TaxID=2822396 RepID=UPI003EFA5C03